MKKTGSLAKALDKYRSMNASVRVGVLEDAIYPRWYSCSYGSVLERIRHEIQPCTIIFSVYCGRSKKELDFIH
jgi:hypothetical protein